MLIRTRAACAHKPPAMHVGTHSLHGRARPGRTSCWQRRCSALTFSIASSMSHTLYRISSAVVRVPPHFSSRDTSFLSTFTFTYTRTTTLASLRRTSTRPHTVLSTSVPNHTLRAIHKLPHTHGQLDNIPRHRLQQHTAAVGPRRRMEAKFVPSTAAKGRGRGGAVQQHKLREQL